MSSPEHSVLKASFCDCSVSVVPCRRRFYIFYFKHHFLLISWVKVEVTLDACSLHEALPIFFKELNFMQNFGCCGSKNEKNFKSLPVLSQQPQSSEIWCVVFSDVMIIMLNQIISISCGLSVTTDFHFQEPMLPSGKGSYSLWGFVLTK